MTNEKSTLPLWARIIIGVIVYLGAKAGFRVAI